nr:MAG TPA: hypothetical protein [Bacteriophage sp.]
MLCVARTFLSRPRPAATGRACPAKVIKFGGFPLRGCDFRIIGISKIPLPNNRLSRCSLEISTKI